MPDHPACRQAQSISIADKYISMTGRSMPPTMNVASASMPDDRRK